METIIENTDTQIVVINNSIELFKSAPEILRENRGRSMKAVSVGNDILHMWEQAWSNSENEEERMLALQMADERSNRFLANCSTANKEMKELRAAITQMMDQFKKFFTEAENELDKAKTGTVAHKVQDNRNQYAAEVHKIEERKRREAEMKAAKAKEAIEIKSNLEIALNNLFQNHLLKAKNWLQSKFNNLSLAHFADDAAEIRTYEPSFSKAVYEKMIPIHTVSIRYHIDADLQDFIEEIKTGKFESFQRGYLYEMTTFRDELKIQLPSKLEELREQKRLADEAVEASKKAAEAKTKAAKEAAEKAAKEAADRAKKAEEDRKQREAAESTRIKSEAEAARKKAEEEAELKKQGEQTLVMFEKEAELVNNQPAPETRQEYDIEVLHPAGYVQIFQFWFENDGKNQPVDKIGKMKMDQMRAFCEKHAQKTGEKIESKFLKYVDSFKAVNRK